MTEAIATASAERVESATRALGQRLGEVARVLGVVPAGSPSETLDLLVRRIATSRDTAEAWLLLSAVGTAFPTRDTVTEFVRELRIESVTRATLWMLSELLPDARRSGAFERELHIVEGGVIIDVDYAAQHEHNSGIQRVVRNTVNQWSADHEVTFVAWGDDPIWRDLSEEERHRVESWSEEREGESDHDHRIVLPWKSTVLLVEVPAVADNCLPLSTLAEFSGSRVGMVGYDTIPITSAEAVPLGMSDHFAKYLAIVKHATTVAGISQTATEEYRGFTAMLPSQGLPGPEVIAVELPTESPHLGVARDSTKPMVLCVGSKEPRKNQVALLVAAERLWREGLDFDLHFIGIYGWDTREFRAVLRRLEQAGRPVTAPPRVTDADLWNAYASARFSVFPSFHEGYGLPVAESLSFGTPVITSDYGSTAEIAADGGCLLVDPRDDLAIVDAMRRLLTDDALIERLRAEAFARPQRRWDEYAAELWTALVE